MDKAIIYIHGFNSSGNSSTGSNLSAIYGDQCYHPTSDFKDAIKTEQQLDQLISSLLAEKKKVMLVGTSLGGFWAYYFSNKYSLFSICINPAIYPNISLQKFLGPQTSFATNVNYIFTDEMLKTYEHFTYNPLTDKNNERIILLSEHDELLDYSVAKEIFSKTNNSKIIIDHKQGHRYRNIEKLQSIIDNSSFMQLQNVEN